MLEAHDVGTMLGVPWYRYHDVGTMQGNTNYAGHMQVLAQAQHMNSM